MPVCGGGGDGGVVIEGRQLVIIRACTRVPESPHVCHELTFSSIIHAYFHPYEQVHMRDARVYYSAVTPSLLSLALHSEVKCAFGQLLFSVSPFWLAVNFEVHNPTLCYYSAVFLCFLAHSV